MDEQIRILCVDDEKNVLRSLERMFIDDDYEVITAQSGAEGLEKLNDEGPTQIVISDFRMPGMNGVEFLKEVRLRWPKTVRIVLSGYADSSAIVSAINEGEVYKFIPKPWNDDELRVAIVNAMERFRLEEKNLELATALQKSNEELQHLNQNLEELVAIRTEELSSKVSVLERVQRVLDMLPFAVLSLDSDGTILVSNKSGRELFKDECANIEHLSDEFASVEARKLVSEILNGKAASGVIDIGGSNQIAQYTSFKDENELEGFIIVVRPSVLTNSRD